MSNSFRTKTIYEILYIYSATCILNAEYPRSHECLMMARHCTSKINTHALVEAVVLLTNWLDINKFRQYRPCIL